MTTALTILYLFGIVYWLDYWFELFNRDMDWVGYAACLLLSLFWLPVIIAGVIMKVWPGGHYREVPPEEWPSLVDAPQTLWKDR
jgi:hypothetical protein